MSSDYKKIFLLLCNMYYYFIIIIYIAYKKVDGKNINPLNLPNNIKVCST